MSTKDNSICSLAKSFLGCFRRHVAFKLGGWFLLGTLVVFTITFSYNNHRARTFITEESRLAAQYVARDTIHRIDAYLDDAETLPRFIAKWIEWDRFDAKKIGRLLEESLVIQPDIFGSAVAFEPRAFSPDKAHYALYAYREEGHILLKPLPSEYDYFSKPWYAEPVKSQQASWSEPYFDEGGGNALMSTFAMPFYREKDGVRVVAGVATSDIRLGNLAEKLSTMTIYKTGYIFLLSKAGQFISHPNPDYVGKENIFHLAAVRDNPDLKAMGEEMVAGKEGLLRTESMIEGRFTYIYYRPVSSCGWSIGIVFPEDEVLANIRKLNRMVIILGAVGFIILLGVVIFLSELLTRPIRLLAGQTEEIARGNLDHAISVDVRSVNEIGKLTSSFENMRTSLKVYIENLKTTTAEKERIESEVKIAREIQTSLLPHVFPAFPDRLEFDLYAGSEPAREVGGDFYDYYMLDFDRLYFAIGDVSGKGIPAALFMAVTKTLLKSKSAPGLSASQILGEVNREICQENDACKFVTLFFGILHLGSGKVEYSNAGHNAPLLLRSGHRVGTLIVKAGVPVGIMEQYEYESGEFQLENGETIVLYTDGVTEARDTSGAFYGDERLIATLQNLPPTTTEKICSSVMGDVHAFAKDCIQSDDITVLAIRYQAPR